VSQRFYIGSGIIGANVNAWLDTRRVFVIVLALGLFAMAARNVTDPDVGWHLRTGELIAKSHAFVRADPFSFTRHGQPWVNHEWLSDLLLYGVYQACGWAGLIDIFGALTAATFMLVFARCPGKPYFGALALVLGAYAAAPSWGVRPHTISLLLASIFLLVLERSEKKPRVLWWTIPLSLLWVNLHAEYALGIALIILFLAGEWLDAVLGVTEWNTARPRLRDLAIALSGCLAIIPLNPNGFQMYVYPVQTLRSDAMQKYIAEWASPNFHESRYLPFALMLLSILFLLSVSNRKLRPRDLVLLLVMTAGALRSVRHISVFVLVAVPVLSGLMQGWWNEHGRRAVTRNALSPRRLAFNALVLVSFLGFAVVRVHGVARHQTQTEMESFPAGAVSFMELTHPPEPIFNHYNFGGYLIWKLYPDYPVYIDGRADLYGDRFLHDFAETYYLTGPNWVEAIEQWKIQTVVLPPDAPLIVALKLNGGWRQVYGDSQATILTRTK
jgi:hypothetical protein